MPTRLTQTGAEVQGDLDKIEDIGLATEEKAGLMSPEDKTKLDNIDAEIPTKLSDLEDDSTHRTVTDTEKQTWNNKSDFSGRYQDLTGRPFIPTKTGDLVNNSGFITRLVDDLANYYLKSEVYTKAEVAALISSIQGFSVKVVDVLPTASAETMRAIYLVPSAEPQTGNTKDEWITVEDNGAYRWEQIGSTAIDLEGYVTDEELTAALQGYVTSAAFATALAGKQDVIGDLSEIRAGAQAGARAYQKPAEGIPAADLSDSVQESLEKADNPPTEVFWATYGETTAAEIDSAVAAGKIVLCSYNDFTYVVVNNNSTAILFGAAVANNNYFLRLVRSNNIWTNTIAYLQASTERVNTISGNETANNRYPTTKAVADYVAENKELFVATPNVTTFSEIQAAVSTGKAIIAIRDNGEVYVLSSIVSSFCFFSNINRTTAQFYVVQSSGWSLGQSALELVERRVSAWRSTPDNNHYPAEKLVKDSLDAKQDTISDLASIRTGAAAGGSAYQKPSTGIPASDLASAVQTSLGKADTALQSFTETDPVFSASAAVGISSSDITSWNSKYTKPSGGIPKTDLATAVQTSLDLADTAVQPEAGKGLFSGNYNDLSNKPTIPTVEALTTSEIDTIWSSN